MNTQRMAKVEKFLEQMMFINKAGGTNKDDFLAKFGLNKAKSEILYFIASHDHVSVKLLAERMATTSSAATQLIDGLVRSDWLDRTHDKDDRRTVVVTLSENGKGKFAEFKKAHLDKIACKVACLDDNELETLIGIHKKILDFRAQ